MARARIMCGECGADIPPGAATCPKCGAAVELPQAGTHESQQVCTQCGFRNTAVAAFCESCGAGLPGLASAEPAPRRGHPRKPARSVPARAKVNAPRKEEGARFEPWQVISGVAILALVAVVIYLLLPSNQGAAPRTVAPQQPRAAASMAQIESLQQAVDSNPRDAAARLRLANILHDGGILIRAVDNYNDYLKLEPKDPNARVDLGICYDQLALQDTANAPRYFSLAVREMETAAKNNPAHQPAAFNLGIVNLHMGNLEESNTWFKRAVELDPNSELGTRAQKILQQHTFPQ